MDSRSRRTIIGTIPGRAFALGCAGLCVALAWGAAAAPITIQNLRDLQFGSVASSVSATGTVTVNATTGAKTVSGGAFDLGGSHRRGVFRVRGDRNTVFVITLPGSATITAGGASATINGFTSNPSGTGILPQNGRVRLQIGATLNLGANQPAGNYSGIYPVTVEYQ